jgi:outer membrane autotransporter protein
MSGLVWSTPLHAAGVDNTTNEELALEAQGTFTGFTIAAPRIGAETLEAPAVREAMLRRVLEAGPVPPQPELIVRDDVGVDFGDPENTQPSVVQLFVQDNTTGAVFFNCTGTLINPRTVLSAAHCFNSRSSEAYGVIGEAPFSLLIATGQSSADRVFNYLDFGVGYSEGGVATSTDVVIHPAANLDNGALEFPWADVAMVALDEPITDAGTMPILLSPLTELTRVLQVGYGTNGTGSGTATPGSSFLRRIGENQLGLIGSLGDYIDGVFPALAPTTQTLGLVSQAYYWTDFDNPNRTPEQQAGCTFTGDDISCADIDAVLAIDYFDGDALPLESGTAPGDSGSPLIVADRYEFPVVAAVLSGGYDFFGLGSVYGDVSFYNPLYPFFEFITENTPYKYVSAKAGSGNWSDPRHWTQDLDPGFFIDDGTGKLVNGIPQGNEPGILESGPKIGTVLGQDISGNTPATTPGFEDFDTSLPESSRLLGPGSTGFVPNNTDGDPGTAFAAPAQYFDVLLNRPGRTRVDIDVEIDKLALDHLLAAFTLPRGRTFSTVIGYEQFNGLAQIDGQFNAGLVALFGGITEGRGTIASEAVINFGAGLAPGGLLDIGTLTIDGDYVQLEGGALVVNAARQRQTVTSDLLSVTGDASLAGQLIVTSSGRVRYGDEFTVLSANSVLGGFDDTLLITFSPLLFAESRVEGGNVIVDINAIRLADLFAGNRNLQSLGAALDALRFGNRTTKFAGLFDVIDGAGIGSLVPTLSSLTPISAFSQTMLANNFSQRFTGQLSQRTLALHGAGKAAAGFSPAGGALTSIAQAGAMEPGQFGFFGTVSGSFLVSAQERNSGLNALEEATFTQAGELTLGTDYRVSEDLIIGFAMTSIRNGAAALGMQPRADDTSVSGAAYAALRMGRGFTDVYFGFSRQSFGLSRIAQGDFQSSFDSAWSNPDGQQSFGGMRVGYAFALLPGLEAGPVASLDYVRSDMGGYTEYGAGDLGLTVLDRSFTSLSSMTGLMAALDTGVGRRGRLSAFGSVAYARELADTSDEVTAFLAGAADLPFTIANTLDPEWVSATAGIELALGSRFGIGITGQSDFGRGPLTNNEARLNVSWKF